MEKIVKSMSSISIEEKNNILYSKNTNGKFLFIRHGETDYNRDSIKIPRNTIRVMKKYINCPLNELGKQQAKKAFPKIKDLHFEALYVSPLARALETAFIIFENHPQNKELKFIVHPDLTEIVGGVHNMIVSIKSSKEIFNMNSKVKFDWSLFDNLLKDDFSRDTYYLKYNDSYPENKINPVINEMKNNYGKKNFGNSITKIANLMVSLRLKRSESLNHAFKRGYNFKQYLKEEYKDTLDNTNDKVLVITHSALLKLATSQTCLNLDNIEDYPKDCYNLSNCEIISIYP